ncbi:MAG: DUF3419 family protein [Bacilli bacterium]|nr:DUF3419 family protein [Bacilli bacterium]
MNELNNDIDISIYMIKNNISYGIENYSSLCLFSNENGQAKDNIFNYKDKKILCPTASGDQYLIAKFYDAREIITYDINKLSKYITELKIASIKALSYEEFLLFLFPRLLGKDNKFFLSKIILKKVVPYLDKNDNIYWNEIISFASKNGYNKFIDKDNECYNEDEIKRECIFYSNYYSFNILKQKLLNDSNFDFINKDIRELKIDGSFDIVDLSNIMTSLIIQTFFNDSFEFTVDELNKIYVDFIDKKIIPLIKYNGDILVDYQIAVGNSNMQPWFYSDKYETYEVKSKKKNNTDIILKYQKS